MKRSTGLTHESTVLDFCKMYSTGADVSCVWSLVDNNRPQCEPGKVFQKLNSAHHNTVRVRSFRHYTKELFCEHLSVVDWSVVLNCVNVDEAWQNFSTVFLVDSLAPFKIIRFKNQTEPWFSNDVIDVIKSCDSFLKKFQHTKHQSFFIEYKKLRNRAQQMINKAKVDYFKDNLQNNNNPKKLWLTLKQLGSSKLSKSNSSIGLMIDGIISFDLDAVVKKFDSFFTTIASNHVINLPAPLDLSDQSHFIKYSISLGLTPDSFALCNVLDICKIFKTVDRSKATRLDNIPSRLVSDAAELIALAITHIINICTNQCAIPSDLKTAKVTPLYKKGSKTESGNYRAVSVPSGISKILEKVIYDFATYRICMYGYIQIITNPNQFYDLQSGFRKSYSKDSCLLYLTLLLDFQKAFDTVDHNILPYKLKGIGCNNNLVKWSQIVSVGGTMLYTTTVLCGVLQVSILGPLLLLIYVNDMIAAVKCELLLYADDSTLLASGKDVNRKLGNTTERLVDNRLSLHVGKTESILFGSKPKRNNYQNINIQCKDQSPIKPQSSELHNQISCKKAKYLFIHQLKAIHLYNVILIMRVLHATVVFLKNPKTNYKDVRTNKSKPF